MRLEVSTQSLDLAPGQQVAVDVRVVNDSAEIIDVELGVAGLDVAGVRPVAHLGALPPGATAATTLHFALPKGASAGLRDVAVHAIDRSATGALADQARQIAHLAIRVGSTERISLQLQRAEVSGRFKGKLRADLRNQGDVPITLRLWGEGDDVAVTFDRETIDLPPGHSARVKGKVRVPGLALRGDHRRAFVVTAQGTSTPATTSGSYVKRGVLPASLIGLVAIVVVLALWITGVVYFQSRLRDGDAKGVVATTTTTTSPDGPGTSTGGFPPPGGTSVDEGAPGQGTPVEGGTPGEGAENGGVAETVAPIKIIGSVDGPTSRAGTGVVLDLVDLGQSSAGSGQATMSAPFASVSKIGAVVQDPQRTVTDGSGKFTLNITKAPALYRVTIFRTGFDVSSQVVNVDGVEKNIDLAIKLVPAAGRLGGRVVDDTGAALGGVAVTVTSGDVHYSTTSADGTGSWELLGVATPATYVLQFTKPGFASASLIQSLEGGGFATNLSVAMAEGLGTIRGEVQSGRQGVGGLRIILSDGVEEIESTTRTDAPVGSFEFPGLAFGNYTLTIIGDGWQPWARQIQLNNNLNNVGIIDDLLSSTAVIRGTVTQEVITTASSTCVVPAVQGNPAAKQEPCGGVGLTATLGSLTDCTDDDVLTPCFRTTSSSRDGSFVLTGIPGGNYTLTFERFGYTTVTIPASVLAGDTLTVDPEPGNLTEDAIRMFVVPRDRNASGRLVATISSSDDSLPLTGVATVITQVGKSVAFEGDPGEGVPIEIFGLFGGPVDMRVSAVGHADELVQIKVPLNAESDRKFVVLTPLGTVTGVIEDTVDGHTNPVEGAVVFMSPTDLNPSSSMVVLPPDTPLSPDQAYLDEDPAVGEIRLCERDVARPGEVANVLIGLCTRTNSSGGYTFANAVRAGEYHVYAPTNSPGDPGGLTALDHRIASTSVTTALNTVSSANLELDRLGAVVGEIQAADPVNGTTFTPLDEVEVTAFFCEQAGADCTFPASNPVNNEPRGRVSAPGVASYRIDRLEPAGFDPTSGETVAKYIIRFRKTGFVDEFRIVSAPALNADVELAIVMSPLPTKVSVTPYFLLAGALDHLAVPGVSVKFTGIVGYSDSRVPIPEFGTVTDATPSLTGAFDSGDMVFLAGNVTIAIKATGFDDVDTFVSVAAGGTSGADVENQVTAVDPDDSTRLLLSGDVRVSATPRDVSVDLDVQCCVPVAAPTNAASIFAALQARLTLDGPPATSVTLPLDSVGKATFIDIEPGSYTLTFEVIANTINLAGHITLPTESVVVLTTGDKVVSALTATVQKATLTGTITDFDEGDTPLPFATVAIDALGISTQTTSLGTYSLDVGNVPGTYVVTISKADGRQSCPSAPLVFNPGEAKVYSTSCLGPRGTVSGTVQGKSNPSAAALPLAGAIVVLRRADTNAVVQTSPPTPADGAFSFTGVSAGTSGSGRAYYLVVTKSGYEPLGSNPTVTVLANATNNPLPNPVVLTASSRAVPVLVKSNTTLSGAAVPLSGVTVTATLDGASDVVRVTNSNGLVTLPLVPGAWTITTTNGASATATGNGYRTPHLDAFASVVVAEGTTDLPQQTISLVGPFLTVTGVVNATLNPTTAAAPLDGAVVTITPATGPNVIAPATGSNGAYTFNANVPVGFGATTTVSVSAAAVGYVTSPARSEALALSAASAAVSLAPIVLAASAQPAVITVRSGATILRLAGITVTATLAGSNPPVIVSGVSNTGLPALTLQLVPGVWNLVTSNGFSATNAAGTVLPHGDTTGIVTVQLAVAAAPTQLNVAPLVAVGGVVTSRATPDLTLFPGAAFSVRDLNGASLSIVRVGAANPVEPVNSFVATSLSNGGYSLLHGLTPGVWDITASAPGHASETIQITVSAATPVTTASIELDELALTLSGTVTAASVGVQNVKVTFTTGDVSGFVMTDSTGGYSVPLVASEQWTVGFDPSAAAVAQDVPVLYRFVGPALGGTSAQLNHVLFADLVELTVVVKGVLPTQCSQATCIQHDLAVPATVTLTDSGPSSPTGVDPFVQFPEQTTGAVSSAQTAVFAQVPNQSTYTLSIAAPGYTSVNNVALDLDAAACSPIDANKRCITVNLNAAPRDVEFTVTDLGGAPVVGAAVQVKSKPTFGVVERSCSAVTNSNGKCTVTGLEPAFTPYPVYDLVVGAVGVWGNLVRDLSVAPGVGTLAVAVNTVPIKPVITVAPSAATEWDGEDVSFTATATGNPAPTVVWKQVDGGGTVTTVSSGIVTGSVAGGTTSTLTFSSVAVAKHGFQYRAEFSNTGGGTSTASTVASANALLSVSLVSTSVPLDSIAFSSETATFTASVTGKVPTVQWERDVAGGAVVWLPITLATGLTYSGDSSGGHKIGVTGDRFRAVFTLAGATGTKTSREAVFTLAPDPVVADNASGWLGLSASFSVNALAGTTVQWQVDERNGDGFEDISLASNATANSTVLVVQVTSAGQNNDRYRAKVTASGVTRTSPQKDLNVKSVTTSPQDVIVWLGETTILTASANTNTGVTLSWERDTGSGFTATGGTNSTFTVGPVTLVMTGDVYRAAFTTTLNTVAPTTNSQPATVTVIALPANPSPASVLVGATATFTTTKPAGTSVQWQVSTNNGFTWSSTGTDSATLAFAATAPMGNNQYRAIVTIISTGVAKTTSPATLTVSLPPPPTTTTSTTSTTTTTTIM